MIRKHDDGLEWLRRIRRKIEVERGGDAHAVDEFYRAAAARIPHKSYRDASASKRVKPNNLAHS
jgi:hypothetical protein